MTFILRATNQYRNRNWISHEWIANVISEKHYENLCFKKRTVKSWWANQKEKIRQIVKFFDIFWKINSGSFIVNKTISKKHMSYLVLWDDQVQWLFWARFFFFNTHCVRLLFDMPKTGTENTIQWVVSHATRKGVHFIYILNEVRNDFFSLKHIISNLFSHEFSYKANTVCIFTKKSKFNGWVEKNWSSYPKIMTKNRVICKTFKKLGWNKAFPAQIPSKS